MCSAKRQMGFLKKKKKIKNHTHAHTSSCFYPICLKCQFDIIKGWFTQKKCLKKFV